MVHGQTGQNGQMILLQISLKSIFASAEALKKGERISLVGFGTFSTTKHPARKGRNPQTGKEIMIAEKTVVKFKAGAELVKSL